MPRVRISKRFDARAPFAVAIVAVLALLAPGRSAAVPDPSAIVAYVGTQGMAVASANVPGPQRVARLRQLFHDYFDVAGLADFALGRYRSIASAPEQREYFALYEEYTVQLYGGQLARYGSAPFRVTGCRTYGAQSVVSSEIIRSDGSPVQIDWYLVERYGRYRITDVVIGGMSMKNWQRHDFADWIQANGGRFDALLAVLRQQIAQAQ